MSDTAIRVQCTKCSTRVGYWSLEGFRPYGRVRMISYRLGYVAIRCGQCSTMVITEPQKKKLDKRRKPDLN